MFGKNKQSSPPPTRRTATMNVGAGQYKSSSVAITMLPTMPPKRAATIDIATPVALKQKKIQYIIECSVDKRNIFQTC